MNEILFIFFSFLFILVSKLNFFLEFHLFIREKREKAPGKNKPPLESSYQHLLENHWCHILQKVRG
jgi:hypothetical protein